MANPSEAPRRENRGPIRRRLRPLLLASIAGLYALSVPWYRADDQPLRLVLGLPDWVAVAVLCYGLVAVLNALVWMQTRIEDDAPLRGPLRARGRGPEEDESQGGSPS
jgi:hypothetical protein